MVPTILEVYITCLLTLLFLFVIVAIVAIYGRVIQRRQKNQAPPEEDRYVEVERDFWTAGSSSTQNNNEPKLTR
ncbi:MAG TPA: hypothetical protein VFK47_23925 [Ktedonobacteraceae bacterium]|nr:hypothetical protein [Ktedonobacteraceae bacterium]